MRIQPKSPATLEAQTVDYFLSEEVTGNIRAVRLGEQITRLLDLNLQEVGTDEAIQEMNPRATDSDLAALPDTYVAYLRRSGLDRDMIEVRAGIIAAYEHFRPTVEQNGLNTNNKIGAGSFSTAHTISVDGNSYVARKVYDPHDLAQLEKHFEASLRVQDIEGIEHIEAISFKDGITIAPRLPGDSIQRSTSETISQVTDTQLQALYKTLVAANERGIYFDTAEGNLLYDSEAGFSVLDISTKHNEMYRSAPEAFAWYFMAAAGIWKPSAQQDSAYGLKLHGILERVSEILENDDISQDTADLLEQAVTKHNSRVS